MKNSYPEFNQKQFNDNLSKEIEYLKNLYSKSDSRNAELLARCKYLEDRHQQDCIRINDLTTTINTLTRMYTQLRKTAGME